MTKSLAALATSIIVFTGTASAETVGLYNGLSLPSQTPAQQGWPYGQEVSGSPAPEATATSSGTVINSGYIGNHAGYYRLAPFTLNRSLGYSINFRVRVNSESHSSNSRAGFNLTVISSRLSGEAQPFGIELGLWQSSIWAQNVGFTRSETASFNTQSATNAYRLVVKGSRYQLFANSPTTPILQGSLRQYTGFTPPPGSFNPYTTPNFIFIGDNTTRATAKVTIAGVSASR